MLRTIIWFLYFGLYQIVIFPKLLKADRLKAENRMDELNALANAVAVRWAQRLLRLAGCKVVIDGIHHVPLDQAVLFVSNHQSNFDIPILMAHVPSSKGFIAKESLEKVPLLSRWMRHIYCVFIKRGSPRDAAAAINQGIAYLKQGHSMVVFPEGTRSADGQLQEFKPGALKLATKANVPIVPVVIDGSIDMMKKGSLIIHPAAVRLHILPPISPETFADGDTVVLTERIRSLIAAEMASERK